MKRNNMTREEAIRRIKARFDRWALDDEDMKAIQTLVPELKESEDERMINELQGFLDSFGSDYFGTGEWQKFDDWLEKQKEQKPAEWSKNDAAFLNEITDFFESKTVMLQHDLDMYVHWLKSLPERFVLQPKQEWSVEDNIRIESCILYLTNAKNWIDESSQYIGNNAREWGKEEIKKDIDWLKTLRPWPHWKPSEEQIYSLGTVIKGMGNVSVGSVGYNLKALYEQLKKLMLNP